MSVELYHKHLPFTDPRLGRHVLHDPRSRGFAWPGAVDPSTWHDKAIRIYDPKPNPNQPNGCCTACAKAMQFNAVTNRRARTILDMDWAQRFYTLETQIDEFPGEMPQDDTGSNGLASCKAAQQTGDGGEYRWIFNGAAGVVQAIMSGAVVSLGTRWDNDMFNPDSQGRIHPGGGAAGGHQWPARGFWASKRLILGRCWWGEFRDFWISMDDLDSLLADDGDAHIQLRA